RHTRFSRDWSSDVCSSDLDCRSPRTAGPRPAARSRLRSSAMTLQSMEASSLRRRLGTRTGRVVPQGAATIGQRFLSRYGLLIGFLVLWQVSAKTGWVNPSIFPPLDIIAAAVWTALSSGRLVGDIAISLQRSGIAFGAAVAIGIPLGLFMGQVRWVEQALDPILQLFRQTAAPALH